MLPFDRKPLAKPVAATVIVLTATAAVIAPLYLRHIRHLDPPMAVLIVLLVLAIIPPNFVVLQRHRYGQYPDTRGSEPTPRNHVYASRGMGH